MKKLPQNRQLHGDYQFLKQNENDSAAARPRRRPCRGTSHGRALPGDYRRDACYSGKKGARRLSRGLPALRRSRAASVDTQLSNFDSRHARAEKNENPTTQATRAAP
jgi:hypothetical protein